MGDRQPRRETHARPARKTGGDSGEIKNWRKLKAAFGNGGRFFLQI